MKVTDHAVIRFMERVLGWDFTDYRSDLQDHQVVRQLEEDGIDVDAVRLAILSDTVRLGGRLGARKVHRHDSVLVLENHSVITVLPKEARHK